jgi:hypothetical protein
VITTKKQVLIGLLSLIVPGLGQIAAGEGPRGALILMAVIIVGNLNALWLSLYALSLSSTPFFWTHTLPRILHGLFAAYGIVFWIWQVWDAIRLVKVNHENSGP